MLNNKLIIILLIHFLNGYSIFNHINDFGFSSSSYITSNSSKNQYNFSNPACNTDNVDYFYSSFGNYFNGVLKSQQLLFSIDTDFLNKINFGIIRSSIDNIPNTQNAWIDGDGDGYPNYDEIDYSKITTFNHSNLGLIISKSFDKRKFQLGINSKFSHSNLEGENSISHSFDFGFYKSIKKLNVGLVIQDFLRHSYWTTGVIEKGSASIILGSKILFKNININFDLDAILLDYSLGIEYNYNSLFYIQLNHTTLKKIYLAFLINFERFNIGYSLIIPQYNQLGLTHTISLGFSKDIFNYKHK